MLIYFNWLTNIHKLTLTYCLWNFKNAQTKTMTKLPSIYCNDCLPFNWQFLFYSVSSFDQFSQLFRSKCLLSLICFWNKIQNLQSRLSWLHKFSMPTSSTSAARSSRALATLWEDWEVSQSIVIMSRSPSFFTLAWKKEDIRKQRYIFVKRTISNNLFKFWLPEEALKLTLFRNFQIKLYIYIYLPQFSLWSLHAYLIHKLLCSHQEMYTDQQDH